MLIGFNAVLQAQEIESLTDSINVAILADDYKKVKDFAVDIQSLAQKEQDYLGQARALYYLGECAYNEQNYALVLEQNQQAEQLIQERLCADTCSLYFHILQTMGVASSMLGQHDKQQYYYKKAWHFAKEHFAQDGSMLANALFNLSAAHYRAFALDSAIIYSDSVLDLSLASKDTALYATALLNRGVLYRNVNDYNEAINCIQRALKYTKSNNETILNHCHLAALYQATQQNNKASEHLEQAVDLANRKNKGQQYQSMVQVKTCAFYLEQGDSLQFLKHWKELNAWIPRKDPNFELDLRKTYYLKAKYDFMKGDEEKVEKGLKWCLSRKGEGFVRERVDALTLYAELKKTQYEFQAALEKVKQALELLDETGLRTLYTEKQTLGDSSAIAGIMFPQQTLELLALQMDIELAWGLHKQDKQYLYQANDTYELIVYLLSQTRKGLKSRLSKLTLAGFVEPFFQNAIRLFECLYQQEKQQKWLDKAFAAMEQNKALLISESLSHQQALAASVPAALAEKERELAIKADALMLLLSNTEDDTEKERIEHERYDVNKEWRRVLIELEESHPTYFYQKYQLPEHSIQTVQDYLITEDDLVLSFVNQDTIVYCIGIRKDSSFLKKIHIPKGLNEQVDQLRLYLEHKSADYFAAAHQVYQQLLRPLAEEMSNKNLVIIPEGKLWRLPFAALVVEQASEPTYLVEKHNLRYWHAAHSAYLLKQNHKIKQNYKYTCSAYAPFASEAMSVSDSSAYMEQLSGSEVELDMIERYFSKRHSRVYKGNDANIDNFYKGINESLIVHISTHALLHAYDPNLSLLYFYGKDQSQAQALCTYQLYKQKMNSALAVVSACSLADDKIHKGEGMAGMSRVLAMAGCPNVIISQWDLNDESSVRLMDTFYRELSQGQGKSSALSQAQRDYIDQSSSLENHPYYWASFIHIGDNEALVMPKKQCCWMVFILLCLVLVLLVFLAKQFVKQ